MVTFSQTINVYRGKVAAQESFDAVMVAFSGIVAADVIVTLVTLWHLWRSKTGLLQYGHDVSWGD